MLNSFCSSILLQLESSSFWECWVLSNGRTLVFKLPTFNTLFTFCCFDIVQTSRSRGQHFCSKFAKIPHLGCPRTFKVPTSSRCPPPSGITLNLSSFWENLTNTNNFTGRAASSEMKRELVIIKTTDCVSLLSIKLTEA